MSSEDMELLDNLTDHLYRHCHQMSRFDMMVVLRAAVMLGEKELQNFKRPKTKKDILHKAISDAVSKTNGNLIRAARMLNISRSTIYRWHRELKGEDFEAKE